MIGPNAGIEALMGHPYLDRAFEVVRVQPPDGMVIELPDGSRWNVNTYPGVPLDVTHA